MRPAAGTDACVCVCVVQPRLSGPMLLLWKDDKVIRKIQVSLEKHFFGSFNTLRKCVAVQLILPVKTQSAH